VSRASFVATTLLRVEVAIVRIDEALGKTCTRVQYPSAVCSRIVHNVLITARLSAHLSAISILI